VNGLLVDRFDAESRRLECAVSVDAGLEPGLSQVRSGMNSKADLSLTRRVSVSLEPHVDRFRPSRRPLMVWKCGFGPVLQSVSHHLFMTVKRG
jgi:hypothetical protein